jgi:exonuclease SbcC
VDSAVAARKRLATEAAAAVGASVAANRAVLDLEGRRASATSWLEARAGQAALAGEWPRWESLLRRHATLVADITLQEGVAEATRTRRDSAVSGKAAAADRVATLDHEFGALERAAEVADLAAAGDDLSVLRRAHAEAETVRNGLSELGRLSGDAARAKGERDEASRDVEEATQIVAAASQELLALGKRLVAALATVDADKASLELTRDALSLEERRHDLADGAPCPLCGATEHPYSRSAPAESLLKKQQAVVSRGEKLVAALRLEETEIQKRLSRGEERAEQGRSQLARHEDSLAKACADYAKLRERADIPGVPARAPDGVEKLSKLGASAAEILASAKAALDGALERKQVAETSRKSVEARRKEVEKERKALRDAELAVERAEAGVAKAEDSLQSLRLLRDGAEGDLDAPLSFLGDWRSEARADAAAFGRSCAGIATDHAGHVRTQAEAEKALGPARAALEGARAAESVKTRLVEEAIENEKGLLGQLAEREAARAGLLGGRPVAEVEGVLTADEQAARSALDAARAAAEAARVDLARRSQELSDATSRRESAESEVAAAEARLVEALARLGIDRARLEALLSRGKEWVQSTRARLQALERAVHEADSTHAERIRRAAAHVQAGRPRVSKEEAAKELALSDQAASAAKDRLSEVQFRLRADEEGRARSATLGVERDAQRQVAARWRALADLIGSSDGKKFRSFAQGLTLDALLRQANQHLLDLAPRYQIMRVPGQDLELQVVDRDLGDEVRSVNGLSGGESFLVSLALALALASIATRVTQSRTLFIDEGFGTLDRDTLEHAMVALESLRASGRTVGVISHVPELHERIGVRVEVERTGVGRSRVIVPE